MFKYEVTYMVEPASWHINEWVYKCEAWTKWGAWKKWLKDTKDHPHYTYWKNRESYRFMRKYIKRVKNV